MTAKVFQDIVQVRAIGTRLIVSQDIIQVRLNGENEVPLVPLGEGGFVIDNHWATFKGETA